MAGTNDNLVNYVNGIILADALNAPLILKEDAGHGVNLQHRKEINLAMLKHVETAELKKPIEGRRPLSARQGFPPGTHPWMTAATAFLPCYLVARRLASSSSRRVAIVLALLSLILRVSHGPLYRRTDLSDLV